jgi:glutamate racemase
VLFLDSGIGGMPYCHHFQQRNPLRSVVYIADRLHFPYGGRKREELVAILAGLTEQAVKLFDPKVAVLACNTASISALSQLRELFSDLPFVGTVPAVKPATLASKTGKIGVLGTELTVSEPYIRELAAENGGGEIIGIAAPDLIDFIERRADSASPEEKAETVRDYVHRFRSAGVDVLVLGCTHFLFLLDEFRQAAAPDITVFDSVKGVTRRVESLLAESAASEDGDAETPPVNLLLLTGSADPEPSWVYWSGRLGFSVSLLEEM